MSPSRTIGLIASLVLVAGLGGGATAVSAGSDEVSEVHLTDPEGDAYEGYRHPGSGRNVDLVNTDIWRHADELVLEFSYVDLVRPRNLEWGFGFWVYRTHRPKLFVEWSESHSKASGRQRYGSIAKVGEDMENWIDCPGLHARRSYRTDVLTFWLPAECFGDRNSMVISGLHTYVNAWDDSDRNGLDSAYGDETDPYDGDTPPLADPA